MIFLQNIGNSHKLHISHSYSPPTCKKANDRACYWVETAIPNIYHIIIFTHSLLNG